MSFSKHFRLSTKASQISTKKCSFLCFNSYQMSWEGSKMGQHLRQNVPFCYLTYTMALACLGICTTIVTIQRMCFKQPLCWGFCHVWHTSTNAQPSRQWLLFQASSSTCETSIWTMIKKVSSHAGRHMFFLMLQLIVCQLDVVTPCCIIFHYDPSPWCQWSRIMFFL